MKEKDFINKVHKALPKEIYRWKINDSYHGGVPDTFYSGPNGFCFVEYKYKEKLPKKSNTHIKITTTEQQRIWLRRAQSHNLNAYIVFASGDSVYVITNPDMPFICLGQFQRVAWPFKKYVDFLTKLCIK